MNNLQKHFLPYELSKELKELGFDEPCLAFYYKITKELSAPLSSWGIVNDCRNFQPSYPSLDCTAPLISQALEFLREKYRFHLHICFFEETLKWNVDVYKLGYQGGLMSIPGSMQDNDSYEQAQLAGITKAIELIKQKKL